MAERKSFLLRMDPALWNDLECWAQDELRSVNGQIEYILKQAVQKRKGGKTQNLTAENAEGAEEAGDPCPRLKGEWCLETHSLLCHLLVNLGLHGLEHLTDGQLVKSLVVDADLADKLKLAVELADHCRIGVRPD